MRLKKINAGALFILFVGTLGAQSFAYAEEPRIEIRKGQKTLILPTKFKAFLSRKFPKHSLPGSSDIQSVWSAVNKSEEGLPYVTWGDYDGNGLTDIAMFVLAPDKKNWEFFVALQKEKGYVYSLGNGSDTAKYPANMVAISTLRKGVPFTGTGVDMQTGKKTSYSYKFPVDAIVWQPFSENPTDIYYWENGKLVERIFGSH